MKTIVNIITVLALWAIMFGGAAIESESIIPIVMITAGTSWFGLRAWVSK